MAKCDNCGAITNSFKYQVVDGKLKESCRYCYRPIADDSYVALRHISGNNPHHKGMTAIDMRHLQCRTISPDGRSIIYTDPKLRTNSHG